jgi:hypothetical protein
MHLAWLWVVDPGERRLATVVGRMVCAATSKSGSQLDAAHPSQDDSSRSFPPGQGRRTAAAARLASLLQVYSSASGGREAAAGAGAPTASIPTGRTSTVPCHPATRPREGLAPGPAPVHLVACSPDRCLASAGQLIWS